ncbi:hypothetical protein SDC9_132521 [bioreactor metagenome]|uniref:Uncharacterized protein n=1 Tax=bioreactor metagenome TaxID=1076179 RepID=A0A645D7D8_9ZZZZ
MKKILLSIREAESLVYEVANDNKQDAKSYTIYSDCPGNDHDGSFPSVPHGRKSDH